MDAWESRPRSFSSQRQGGAQYSEGVVYSEHQVLGDGHELLHDPMAEDGFAFSGGIRGIYSALDLEVAFRNARKIQHDGKWFKVGGGAPGPFCDADFDNQTFLRTP